MRRLLVPVSRSETLRRSVEYAVESAINEGEDVVVHVVFLPQLRAGTTPTASDEGLLEEINRWIETAATGAAVAVEVELATLETDSELYAPLDVVEVLEGAIEANDIDHVVLDPGYGPERATDIRSPIEGLLREGTTASVEVAPVDAHRGLLPGALDLPRITFIFTVSLVFYLILAGGVSAYALATGVITGGLVTATIGAISLWYRPALRFTPMRFLRALIYIPYLLVAITRANLDVSRVILHPRLPIDPEVVRYRPAVSGPFPLATLANSITLTPGTLSMRIDDGTIVVHSLTADARAGLRSGSLERAVRFLFFGRRAMRVATPAERGDIETDDQAGDGA